MGILNSNLPLVSAQCCKRAEQMRMKADLCCDQYARETMNWVAAAYDALATLRISLERDLELRAKSDDLIQRSMIEIGRNWRWVG